MRLDRSHVPWAILSALATFVMALFYLATFHPQSLPLPFDLPTLFSAAPRGRHTYGGTAVGLTFGTLALLIFLFASALGIRKKRRLWRIGNVRIWLRAHIWLSILTLPLVAFHGGFQLGGPHTKWLMVLYAIVMLSGFFGLALQQFMPGLMRDQLPHEVVFEQIPHIRRQYVAAAEEVQKQLQAAIEAARQPLAADAAAVTTTAADPSVSALNDFLVSDCLPYLRLRNGRPHRLGSQSMSDDLFRTMALQVSEKYRPPLDDTQRWCDERRMMDRQLTMQHWLHGWLLVHVPMSFALIVWTVWHAYIEIEYL